MKLGNEEVDDDAMSEDSSKEKLIREEINASSNKASPA
jgi:hypothetical protein